MGLNALAEVLVNRSIDQSSKLRISSSQNDVGSTIVDFGVKVAGGLEAGLALARICMADLASVTIQAAEPSTWSSPFVQVISDQPLRACMASQYAGWPVQFDNFFAMGSGPMRSLRGREHVLEALKLTDDEAMAVGILECDKLPQEDVCRMIAEECRIEPEKLILCVAPTRSIAGTVQVVARSVETSLHKLFELGFDLNQIVSAHGTAPLAPPAPDFAEGIGRTNDSILYGGRVTLWVDADDAQLAEIGPKVPSGSSRDWGRPFAHIFRDYKYDFYQVDPGLFSPAEVSFHNLRSGKSYRFGSMRPDVLAMSFGY
jgi:methenyltetrahydromethanopterin cyclohydrolase